VTLLSVTGMGLSVLQLQTMMGLTQSRVSRHLAMLRTAGVVVAERDGSRMIYNFAPQQDEYSKALLLKVLEVFQGKKPFKDLYKYGMRQLLSKKS
jgi:DNA-binding transcriptional ArsR family regulator